MEPIHPDTITMWLPLFSLPYAMSAAAAGEVPYTPSAGGFFRSSSDTLESSLRRWMMYVGCLCQLIGMDNHSKPQFPTSHLMISRRSSNQFTNKRVQQPNKAFKAARQSPSAVPGRWGTAVPEHCNYANR
ncbi:hypothetical protein BGZ57DRAFT_888207 [Hyaloscypha finlandica]|nr:hypothetical protein BGZ57DRAFT_888207 [Hyaloscypha finlandica]